MAKDIHCFLIIFADNTAMAKVKARTASVSDTKTGEQNEESTVCGQNLQCH